MNSLKPISSPVLFWLSGFIFSLSSSFQVLSQAQLQFEKLQGTVIDSATVQPIPQVNIWTNHSSTISDVDGNFSLLILVDDTVHFSHISYHDLTMKHGGKSNESKIRIALQQRIQLLEEVKIYSYLSENAFRQKIMETTPVLSREEEIAQINSKIITYLAKFAPSVPMNANDNYIEYMKGPQGVVIFSSSSSKGLIRAIKNVIRPNLPSYKRFLSSDSSMRTLRIH